ncbi:HD domain protein [Aspergillus sclerotialis]|uniref:HD domain protein n=1 Tax=Aspergillus sclerotialis TaxID=2070753 RepID=A0A3A3A8J5_9EURO|nr:HD domain protein [Aspergillus sclerotialis]
MELKDSSENVGRVGHETIGAEYLRSMGFSESVCRLVGSHVAAKRFLTAIDKSYYDSLSSASKKSLEFQGGPFEGEELDAFLRDPLRDQMVAMRRWDDAAKVEGIIDETPRAETYLGMIQRHLERSED